MPLRVRCRCGQEVTLRFNEWVYLVVGLLALCVLINTGALVLVYSRLDDLSTTGSPPRAPAESGARNGKAGDGPGARTASEAAPVPAPEEPAAPAAPGGTSEPAHPGTRGASPAVAGVAPPPAESVPQAEAVPPREGAGSLSDLVDELRREAESRDDTPEAEDEADAAAGNDGAADPAGAESRVDADVAPGLSGRKLAAGVTRFERLIVLESASERPELFGALLHDPDEAIRSRALALLSARVAGAKREELGSLREALGPWLPPLRDWLQSLPRGRELLSKFETAESGPSGSPDWEGAAGLASELLASLDGYPSLQRSLAASRGTGTDIVLAVDVSESMEIPLHTLKSAAPWLFRSLLWAIPDLRVGIVFYRDHVESVAPFADSPAELTEAMSRERAEGGGDVPEGVHEAIEGALQLGRFAWRPRALKSVIVVGDASPPRPELRGLLSLVREAHREQGFRLHAVSLQPEAGRKAVPFFPELAGAGRGRAVTAGAVELPGVLLELCFPSESAELVRRTLPALRGLGS